MVKSQVRRGRPGYEPTCPHCNIQAVIREDVILNALAKGIDMAGFVLVNKKGSELSVPACILNDLVRVLRHKGFRVV